MLPKKAVRTLALGVAGCLCMFLGSAIGRAWSPSHHIHDVNSFVLSVEDEAVKELHELVRTAQPRSGDCPLLPALASSRWLLPASARREL